MTSHTTAGPIVTSVGCGTTILFHTVRTDADLTTSAAIRGADQAAMEMAGYDVWVLPDAVGVIRAPPHYTYGAGASASALPSLAVATTEDALKDEAHVQVEVLSQDKDKFVKFYGFADTIEFCREHGLPVGSAVVATGNAAREFLARVSSNRDATTNASYDALVRDLRGMAGFTVLEGNIQHANVLGDVLEGLVIHTCTVRGFWQGFTLEDAIGSHACSLETSMRVSNGIPLGCSFLLPVGTVNCVQTLKASPD
jgi:hypothetical protein